LVTPPLLRWSFTGHQRSRDDISPLPTTVEALVD
jgi:hypothetical protein